MTEEEKRKELKKRLRERLINIRVEAEKFISELTMTQVEPTLSAIHGKEEMLATMKTVEIMILIMLRGHYDWDTWALKIVGAP